MYVIVDERPTVAGSYARAFEQEGVSTQSFLSHDFRAWLEAASPDELERIESFLLADFEGRTAFATLIRQKSRAPLIALSEQRSLQETLALFSAKFDDVVRGPVHVREIMARAQAIWRRLNSAQQAQQSERLTIYHDGRDPEIDGVPVLLPRRERHILQYLARNRGRWVTKAQIFNAVYNTESAGLDETVVEGHVSKLRKKLRQRLGHDPVRAKRLLGYSYGRCDEQSPGNL